MDHWLHAANPYSCVTKRLARPLALQWKPLASLDVSGWRVLIVEDEDRICPDPHRFTRWVKNEDRICPDPHRFTRWVKEFGG
jgi:hypothetical protein